ncbi:hypothetical protein A2U01_0106045, partial [Trifolium medium]|nr:hypothetical protein [Trifolium medium]
PEQRMRHGMLLAIARRAGEDGASRQSVRIVASEEFHHRALRSFIRRIAQLHRSS